MQITRHANKDPAFRSRSVRVHRWSKAGHAPFFILTFASGLAVTACASGPGPAERAAQRDAAAVGSALGVSSDFGRPPPSVVGPPVFALRPDSPESDFVQFALYHHPAIRAAYFDWRASVAAIAPNRALPDPQFTFQADIARTVMSFMPGLMVDVMAWDKRAAMADEAAATSTVAYRTYVATVLRTAAAVRKAWVEVAYAEDVDRLYRQTIATAESAVALASADYTTGRGMGNLDAEVRFRNVLAQHHAHHAAVADELAGAQMKFKAALGLLPTDPDPAWPKAVLSATPVPPEAEIWQRMQASNPDLAKMRAMVDMAVAGVEVARQGGVPDFSAGLMADLKASPLMLRPTATVTLPIWREKIASNIGAAEARRDAAQARVSAEQLNLAAELAQMLYMVRQSDEMLAYIDHTALPNFDRSIASAQAGAESGAGSASMIAETQLMAIDLRHERLDMLRDRENAVVDLALMMAAVAPENPLLVAAGNPK